VRRACPSAFRADERAGSRVQSPADGRHTGAVLDPALPRTRTGRIWTYVGDDEHPYTVYDYTPNRSRDGPDAFLKEFSGFLQADAYSGYDQLYKDPARDVTEWRAGRTRDAAFTKRSLPT